MAPRLSIIILALIALLGTAFAKEEVVAANRPVRVLWEKGAPLAKGENDKSRITICLPDPVHAKPVGVVVCPGGGYGGQAMDHEGYQVADWLNSQGIAAFILEYRVGGGENVHPAPLLDAQRAIRTVRARAAEFKIDPARIGILGFSAGGHLTSTAGTHFDAGNPKAEDPIDRVSCRPGFMVLIYPVITMTAPYTHEGSRGNLLGENPDEELVNLLSNEKQVTAETPPAFLVHTTEDKAVPSENSVQFYLAMKAAGVPVELHLFEKGPHGFGLAPSDPALSVWPGMCVQWLRGRGILDP
jgi:acetyl esterase/lipase